MDLDNISTYHAIQILEDIGDGILVVDRARRIVYWNQGATKITGHPGVSVLNTLCQEKHLDCIDDSGNHLCHVGCPLTRTLTKGEEISERVWVSKPDGSRIPLDMRVFPLRDHDGHIIGAVEVLRDITQSLAQEQYRNRLIELLRRFTPPYFFKELAQHAAKSLSGHLYSARRAHLTIVFYDLCGFARNSSNLTPETTITLLNQLHLVATEKAGKYGGVIDKFLGDGALVLFTQGQSAVDFATELLEVDMPAFNTEATKLGVNPLQLRITVNSGLVVLGVMGGNTRSEATIMGEPVNIASRMLRVRPYQELLITGEVRDRLLTPEAFPKVIPPDPGNDLPELFTR